MTTKEELLRKLRGRLAYTSGCEPYVIFPDTCLVDILKVEPKTIEQLTTIKGFPREGRRVERWGVAIVAIFQNEPIKDFEITYSASGDHEVNIVKMMNLF